MSPRLAKRFVFAAAALLGTACIVGDVAAQGSRGNVTSRNSRTTGRQSYQAGGSSRNQQLPTASGGGMRGQQGGFGQGQGAGTGPTGGMAGQGGTGTGPMAAGLAQGAADRFQEGGFVGRDANDVRAGFESTSGGRGPGGMMDAMIENLNEMRDARRRWREQNAAPSPIRVRLVPAFDVPIAPAAAAAANPAVQARLTRIMQTRGVGSPQVELARGVAVIRGVVATDRDRALLARIASLEPGVTRVENLVTVEGPPLVPPQLP
jgi:hypothetical protein